MNNVTHDLATAYATVKLSEYMTDKREAVFDGIIDFSEQEVQYFKSAYDFAISHLSE